MAAAKQHIPIVKKRMFPVTCSIPLFKTSVGFFSRINPPMVVVSVGAFC
jgi:hypothetical protein